MVFDARINRATSLARNAHTIRDVLLPSDRIVENHARSPRHTATARTSKKKGYFFWFFADVSPHCVRKRLWLWRVKRTSLSPGRIRREYPWLPDYGAGTEARPFPEEKRDSSRLRALLSKSRAGESDVSII